MDTDHAIRDAVADHAERDLQKDRGAAVHEVGSLQRRPGTLRAAGNQIGIGWGGQPARIAIGCASILRNPFYQS